MAYVVQFVLLVLISQVVDVSSKPRPPKDDVIISETTGHLYGMETSGTFRRLHRRDIDNIISEETHHLRLHTLEGDDIDMEMQEGSVWGKDSVLVIRRGEQTFNVPHAGDRGCHLHGRVTSHSGAVQMNRCGKMTGKIHTMDHQYEIEEIPTDTEIDDRAHARFKVTKKKSTDEIINEEERQHLLHQLEKREIFEDVDDMEDDDDDDDDDDNNNNSTHREKRSLQRATIELAIFVDAFYLDYLKEFRDRSTPSQIQQWLVEKWNLVQGVYSNPQVIGAKITIAVKKIEVWTENPRTYPGKFVPMFPRLKWFCKKTPQGDDFDQKVLYTLSIGGHALGLAYVGHTCKKGLNCYVVNSDSERVGVELHEMGHNLAFPHDAKFGNCVPSSGMDPNSGFMGHRFTYNYLDCYKKKLQRHLRRRSYKCVREQNVFEDLNTDVSPTSSGLFLPFGC